MAVEPTQTPRPTATPTPKARTLINVDWGYTIEIQPGWEVDETDMSSIEMRFQGSVFYITSDDRFSSETLQSYDALIWDYRSGQRLPDTVQSLLIVEDIQLPTGVMGVRRVWERPGLTIAGDTADFRFMNVVVRAGPNSYELFGISSPTNWGTIEPSFEEYLATFRLTNLVN